MAKFRWIVAAELTLVFFCMTFLLPGGQDLAEYYRPLAEGCISCGFVPYPAVWLLFPLSWIPEQFQWSIWTGLTCLVFIWASRRLGTNPLVTMLSFPFMGLIWLGQVDAIVVVGLVLALTKGNVWLKSVGLLMMALKPQVAAAAVVVVMWDERERLKLLLLPSAVLALSFLVWGIDWPLRWLTHQPGEHIWRIASLFPYGLVSLAAVPLVRGNTRSTRVALIAQSIAVPFFGIYSYVVFLVLGAPWWAVPLSYAWVLLYPWYGTQAMSIALVLPVALLVHELHAAWRQREARTQLSQTAPRA